MDDDAKTLRWWLVEREQNALRIASGKTGQDRTGWLEDAAYFRRAYTVIDSFDAENAAHRQAQAAVFRALGPGADPDRDTWPAQIEEMRRRLDATETDAARVEQYCAEMMAAIAKERT